MLRRGVRIITIIICCIMLFSINNLAFAKNGNNNDDNKQHTKKILVKYRDKDSKREKKLNEKKDKQKLKKYRKVNKRNLYSIEVDDSELATLIKDSDIELVEEDAIIQLLCDDHHASCSDIDHDNINSNIHIFSEDSDEEVQETADYEENVDTKQDIQDAYSLEGLCILCQKKACNDEEECMDTTHYICNDCIRVMLGDIPVADMTINHDGEEAACICSDEAMECKCHELSEAGECLSDCTCEYEVEDDKENFWKDYIPCCDTCSFDCVSGPCCDQCIYGDIYYQRYEIFKNEAINAPFEELEVGYDSLYLPSGEKIYWNILRTKSNLLHDNNIKGSGIKVAIFDTGIDINHKELKVAGGISFVEGINSYDDDNGHGTAMAGILASKLNGHGIVGIAPDVDLYSVKVLDKDGVGRYSNIIQGIEWAMENGINIISLSLGSNQYSQILEEAINLAIDNNILIVAAAGNGGADNIMYPAAYPQVICVGATDSNNTLATFSNYGFQLDIVAPGASIVTTGRNNMEVTVDGTSPATQHVAGVAALLWSVDKNLTNGHIKYLLYKNTYDIGEYNNYGHGLLDAELSLRNLESKDYSIYSDENSKGTYIEGLVDVGWDGVVYGQACKHVIVEMAYTAPTCTKKGYLAEGCNKCGFMQYAGSVPKLGHNNLKIKKDATCTSDGYKQTICTRCKYISAHTEINALGHNIDAKTTPPTCTSSGKTVVKCTRTQCSYTDTKNLDKLGHSWTPNSSSSKAATCTSKGYTAYRCTRCSSTKKSDYDGPLGHNHKPTTVSATCTAQGYTSYTCTRCSDLYTSGNVSALGHNWVYDSRNSTCTEEGYSLKECSRCPEYTLTVYPASGHNYSSYVNPTHTTNGHYWGSGCSSCGYGGSSGYQTLSNCLSCTTAPSVSFTNMSGSTVLCETDTSFKPQIKVFDNENDSLTCKYHLDGSTTPTGTTTVNGTKPEKTVAFTTGFNVANLSEGNHTIKATAKDNIAPMGETTITFKVDKSAPTISNLVITPATNNVKFTVTASDSISGLASAAYRYTVNGVATGWLSAGTYTKTGLIPNTSYSYTIEVKDNKGHIAAKTDSFITTVEKPVVSVTALHENNIQTVIMDNNPALTQYRIKVGDGYVNSSGVIVSSESWITIPYDASVNGKRIVLSNLHPNTSYTVIVSARNTSATEISIATSVSAVTSPAAPTNIAVTSVTYEQISLQWQSSEGAVQYEILREIIDNQGNIIEAHTKIISKNYLYDYDLLPEQDYIYSIRSINQDGIYGIWSSPKTQVRTLTALPEKVTGVLVDIDGSELAISWNEVTNVVGYVIEVIYDGNIETLYSTENKVIFDTGIYNCQCNIKVKAFNRCDDEDPDNPDLWTGEGEWSDSALQYTSADIPVISLVDDTITPNSVTVSWDIGQNIESVRYLLNITNGDNVVEIPVLGTSAIDDVITYLVTGLAPETSYGFKVKAVNAVDMDTEWSNQVNTVTLMDYPAIPGRLRATAKSDRISLFWDPADNAQSYILEKDGVILASNWLETSYVDTNVLPDTEYNYRVKAVNTTAESDWSLSLSKKTLGNVPVSPMIASVSGSSISVTIEWETSETVSGYEVEADGEIYNIGLNTMFEHNGLLPGTSHVYAVRSRNIYGRSEWSDFVTYKTNNLIPDIPTILQVVPSEERISVLWSAVDGAVYYEIEIDGIITGSTSSLGYHVFINENDSGPEYTLRVRAVNESGDGAWTAPYPIILLDDGGSIPDIPIPITPQLACSVTGSDIVNMEWNSVSDASYYQLEADNSVVYTGTEIRYIHTGNLPNSQHSYRVRAGNLSGQSQWSEPVIAITRLQYDTTPQNINYFRVDDNATKIVWDQVADITDYIVRVNNAVSGSAITGTSIVIPTEPGELYNIQVASVMNEGGTEYLDWSDEITFRTSRKSPNIPENIDFVVTSDSITITWDEAINAQGYEVETFRGEQNVGSSTTFTLTGLNPSTSYKISVRAYNEAGVGAWSELYNINTLDETPGVLANILCYSHLSENNLRGSSILIKWDNVRRAISYEVEDRNGNTYVTDTNEIVIGELNAGTIYLFRVRAITKNTTGAWSSWIYIMPIVEKPRDVTADMVEEKIHIAWQRVSINDLYEIEIDGVSVETTEDLSQDFDYSVFYLQRKVRIRALRDHMAGIWSDEVEFGQPLPINVSVYNEEEFSVLLPATNVEIGSHKITLTYNSNEVELIDACEITADANITNSFIEELKTHVMIENDGDMVSITFLVDDSAGISYSGIINSIRFRSKVTGDITLHYGVTLR